MEEIEKINKSNKILKELSKKSDELFLNQPCIIMKKRKGHSIHFQSLEARFGELFDDIENNNDVKIENINTLLKDAFIELLDHRLRITNELMPLLLELQKTIQDLMPMNQLLTGCGDSINWKSLEKDSIYLECRKAAEESNSIKKILEPKPLQEGETIIRIENAQYIPQGIILKVLADHLYSKEGILWSLNKLLEQDFLDEIWLHHITTVLCSIFKELDLSKKYQESFSSFELLKDYFSLLNTMRTDFYYVRSNVKLIAAEAGIFLGEYKRGRFEYITVQLTPFLFYIREFWDTTNSLSFSIESFLIFARIKKENEEFTKLVEERQGTLRVMLAELQKMQDRFDKGLEKVGVQLEEARAQAKWPLEKIAEKYVKTMGFDNSYTAAMFCTLILKLSDKQDPQTGEWEKGETYRQAAEELTKSGHSISASALCERIHKIEDKVGKLVTKMPRGKRSIKRSK